MAEGRRPVRATYLAPRRPDISKVTLRNSSKPLSKKEILSRVSEQRFVKENTIALNLQDRDYFTRDSRGRYTIKEA